MSGSMHSKTTILSYPTITQMVWGCLKYARILSSVSLPRNLQIDDYPRHYVIVKASQLQSKNMIAIIRFYYA